MKTRKGEITLKILEVLGSLATDAFDLLSAFLAAGYGASYGKLQYELSRRNKERNRKSIKNYFEKAAKQKYYNLIYKLKKDGLIEEKITKNKKTFLITRKGKEKLSLLKEQDKKRLPIISYPKEEGNKFIIVSFDIPEKEKRKREWLREALKNLGLKIIQKSVFIGKTKIPKKFLDDLAQLKLIDFSYLSFQ